MLKHTREVRLKLQRYQDKPILSPNPANDWESTITTNPGAWYDEDQREVKLLYRAAGADPEHVVRLGLAVSKDGYHFERASGEPAFGPSADGIDAGVVEDARIVKFGEYYYVTYAARPFVAGQYFSREDRGRYEQQYLPKGLPEPFVGNHIVTCLAVTKDFKKWVRLGVMTDRKVMDHDVIIFPEKINDRYAVLSRPLLVGDSCGTATPAIWLSSTDDLLDLSERRIIARPRLDWEGHKIGGNCPPIKTPEGWLLLYHGVGLDRFYRVGAMLLDLADPFRVLHRTPRAILEPELDWEINGHHNWAGVVFPCGNVVIGDTLFVYYGAADKYVGLATCSLRKLVDYLLTCPA